MCRDLITAARQHKAVVFAAIPFLAVVGVVFDIFTPLGVADWVWYFIPLLLSVYVGGRCFPYMLAAVFSLLTFGGLFLSEPGIEFHLAFTSRLIGVCVQWLMAFLISQRKRVESELSQSRQMLRLILDTIPQRVFWKDRNSKFLGCNRSFALDGGYSDPKELVGKDDFETPWKVMADRYRADDRQVLDTGKPKISYDEPQVRHDGAKFWLTTSKVPLLDQDGSVIGVLGTYEDITERKQAEETLTMEQRLLDSLITAIPDTIYFKDRQSRFIRVNMAFTRKHGLPDARTVLGKTDFDLFGGEHARQAYEDEQQIMAQGQPMIDREEKEDWKDGHVTWVSSTKMPLRDSTGHIVGVMGISRDITESKRAQEKIQEQAALLDEAQDAIWVIDPHDQISYWNKGAENLYGWSAAEAIGKNPVELLHKEIMTPQLQDAIKAVNERGEWRGEMQEITKEGKTVISHARANMIRDDQGRRKSLLIINTDITEKKKLETQFLRAQRMESLGTLAGGIAHDLNNVLAPLLLSIRLLKEKITDADGQGLLELLNANVQRGANLVKQVLAFGRGVAGERASIHPKHIAREIREIVCETLPKSVGFELHSDDDLWAIIGDPTQLQQVLLNLCVNARDAMPNGGRLSIHMENALLDEAYAGMNPEARPGPYVLVKVADNGTGIPKEIQDKIFDPLFTTKEPGKGTGLGLSTTLGIVKSHGGFINCYSEPGKGSTFKVYLPANTALAGVEKVVAGEARLPRGDNELVLIVDDEEPIRKLAQKVLERFGYRTLLAADGIEAVSLCRTHRSEIDVVVTDMAMPIMDGSATIAALKTVNPEIKIIGSSGLAPNGYEVEAARTGVRHFIPKPYTTEVMLNTLHEVLNGK